MFALAGLAAPLIGNMIGGMLGGIFGGQGNQGSHGCHGNHGHNNFSEAIQDFRAAQKDYSDAARNFSQGNFFGGISELASARQHEMDGLSHLTGGRGCGWV